MVEEIFFIIGSLSGGLSVAMGAFGAHALKSRLSPVRLENFETSVHYQMYHALALLGASYAATRWPASLYPVLSGWLFISGTLLFSGSLYLLALTDKRWFGAITPFGGLAFIAGWICLALAVLGA